jgi:hypothetical protein
MNPDFRYKLRSHFLFFKVFHRVMHRVFMAINLQHEGNATNRRTFSATQFASKNHPGVSSYQSTADHLVSMIRIHGEPLLISVLGTF